MNQDPLSACCGDPGDCQQAHLYCFNRKPKEADVVAMTAFEQAARDEATAAQAAAIVEQAAARESLYLLPGEALDPALFDANKQSTWAQTTVFENGSPPLGAMEEPLEKDDIKRPDHYARFAIEPCTFIMMNELPYWAGNVVKYVTRAPHKHKDERIDIRKAIRYCEMRIEALDREAAGTDGDVIGNPL